MPSSTSAATVVQKQVLPTVTVKEDELIAQLAAEDVQTDAALHDILVERNAEASRLAALARSMEERDREIVTLLHQKEKLDRAQVLLRHQCPQAGSPPPLPRGRPQTGAPKGAHDQDHDLLKQLAAEEAKINSIIRRILAERDTEAVRLATLARAREERDREIIALLREKKKQDREIQAFVEGLPDARRAAAALAAARSAPDRNGTNGASFHKANGVRAEEPRGLPEPALERAGLALCRVSEHLRDVRERWPATSELARRLQEVEELARGLVGQVTETLRRRAERRADGSGWSPCSPDLDALVQIWSAADRNVFTEPLSSDARQPADPSRKRNPG